MKRNSRTTQKWIHGSLHLYAYFLVVQAIGCGTPATPARQIAHRDNAPTLSLFGSVVQTLVDSSRTLLGQLRGSTGYKLTVDPRPLYSRAANDPEDELRIASLQTLASVPAGVTGRARKN